MCFPGVVGGGQVSFEALAERRDERILASDSRATSGQADINTPVGMRVGNRSSDVKEVRITIDRLGEPHLTNDPTTTSHQSFVYGSASLGV